MLSHGSKSERQADSEAEMGSFVGRHSWGEFAVPGCHPLSGRLRKWSRQAGVDDFEATGRDRLDRLGLGLVQT